MAREGNSMDVLHGARQVRALVVVGVMLLSAPASALCRPFGTQIECEGRESRVVIGTQAARKPAYTRSFWPQPFHGGGGGLGDRRAATDRPVQVDVQDIGTDPSLCRRIGNETYCY
jgi:hypothetical protein